MNNIIIITKTGEITTKKVKDINEDNIYSKCGFKNNNNFSIISSLAVKDYYINIYAKYSGKSNFINNYKFPKRFYNIEKFKEKYYGNILVFKTQDGTTKGIVNYTIEDFNEDLKIMTLVQGTKTIKEETKNVKKCINEKNSSDDDDDETTCINGEEDEKDSDGEEYDDAEDDETEYLSNNETIVSNINDTDNEKLEDEDSEDDFMSELEEEEFIDED